jgi:YbbR domain-containing protein
MNVPVHLRDLHQTLTAQASPALVDVVLRGRGESLERLNRDSVTAYVDLKGLGLGEYSLTVHADPPDEAGVTAIDPATVKVSISGVRD